MSTFQKKTSPLLLLCLLPPHRLTIWEGDGITTTHLAAMVAAAASAAPLVARSATATRPAPLLAHSRAFHATRAVCRGKGSRARRKSARLSRRAAEAELLAARIVDQKTRWELGQLSSSISAALQGVFRSIFSRSQSQAQTQAPAQAINTDTSGDSEESRNAMIALTKAERLESQSRIVTKAIRASRERGLIDEEEPFFGSLFGSFFDSNQERSSPLTSKADESLWFDLGPEPWNWGRDVPPVNDKWLEALSLGLTRYIARNEAAQKEFATYLVDDYDLEDHERLEQLGDSIVNMSSRLLAYESYPDINEGTLSRLSNYPTQNNILGILFREAGLRERRYALRTELDDGRLPPLNQVSPDRHEKIDLNLWNRLIKRDADMFEAYVAAVFLSHDKDFTVVHNWLKQLFRPFQEQAYRHISQSRTGTRAENDSFAFDPILSIFEATLSRGSSSDFLTVAARARRQRQNQRYKLFSQQGPFAPLFSVRHSLSGLRTSFRRLLLGSSADSDQPPKSDSKSEK